MLCFVVDAAAMSTTSDAASESLIVVVIIYCVMTAPLLFDANALESSDSFKAVEADGCVGAWSWWS